MVRLSQHSPSSVLQCMCIQHAHATNACSRAPKPRGRLLPICSGGSAALQWCGLGDGVSDGLPEACGRSHTRVHNEMQTQRQHTAYCSGHPWPPPRLHSTVMSHIWSCWYSCSVRVADLPLRARCSSGMHCMFRSPVSLSHRALASTCDAFARILRPIRAEMAENEAI
jgi:hypothetical protein